MLSLLYIACGGAVFIASSNFMIEYLMRDVFEPHHEDPLESGRRRATEVRQVRPAGR